MSRIDVSTTAVLVSNVPTIQLYKYEPFNNVFSVKPEFLASDRLTATGTSGDILGFISSNVSSTVLSFSSSNGLQASASNLTLVINDICEGFAREALTYTVNVGPGRFTAPVSGAALSLYRNEPVFYNDSLSSRTFVASIPITQPITTPALPTGLVFDGSGTTYNLSGTPILQSPARDYTVIGRGSADPSKVVTTTIRMSIGTERIVVDLSGNTTVTDMTIGSNIVDRAVFARCPPYPLAGSNVFYAWSALPEGLYFANISGTPVSSPYLASDASSTLLLKGAPTENAARTLSIPFVTNVTAYRRSLPSIAFNVQYSFSFVPTVLFNPLGAFSNQYVNAASRLSNRFFAYTRFGTDVSITDISMVSSLPANLDLSFNPIKSEAYIIGTPLATSSANYTVRATDASSNTRDISFDLAVVNDTVTFNPLDISTFTFVVARSLSNSNAGYYPYPIQFSAVSAAGCNVTYSASGLPNGIDLTSNGLLFGTPTEVSSRASYTVTGTASGTNVSNTTIFDASVLAEQFYWPTQTFAFFQNIPITPFQFRVTTLSERPVVSYSSTTEPLGLNLNSTGRLTGTPASNVSGTMLVSALTGLATDTRAYPYTVAPETIAMYTPQSVYPLVVGTPIGIPVNSVAYSGQTVSNFRFSNLDISYGLTINPTTGVISGTPNSNLNYIVDCNAFVVKGSVGLADGQLGARIVTTDYYRLRYFAGAVAGSNFKCVYSDLNPYTWQPSSPVINMADTGGGNDFQSANGVFLVPNPTGYPATFFRSTNGTSFYDISPFSTGANEWWMSATAHKPGTDKWWGVGIRMRLSDGEYIAVLYTSIDNGLTWNVDDAPEISSTTFQTRDANFAPYNGYFIDPTRNAYLRAGAAIAYKNGVLMVGGLLKRYGFGSALRSTDEGLTWSNIPTSFARETAFINTDNSGIWVMTGSDLYSSADDNPDSFTVDTTTIRYSTDQGETWSPAVGDFNMLAYNITYASNTWIATGLDCVRGDVPTYTPGARFSTDGSNWSLIQLPATMSNTERYVPPLPISPFCFDGSWNTIVETGGITPTVLYTHDTCATTFTNSVNWVGTDVTSQFVDIGSRLTYLTNPTYASPSVPSSILQFPTVGAGAAITSPASSYLFYQFVPIEPIVFASALPGATFFVTGVPTGFSYNPVTQTLTGTPSQLGHSSFQVTARDSGGGGITTLTVSINVVIPRVVRPQSGAGAYTSLVRQYVEVNAAQNSRDKKVLPGEPLGEFMAPPAPDKISDVICCPPTN